MSNLNKFINQTRLSYVSKDAMKRAKALGEKKMQEWEINFNNNKEYAVEYANTVANGGVMENGENKFAFHNINKIKNRVSNNEKSVANSVAEGGFDPIVNLYAAKTTIHFDMEYRFFGDKYTKAGKTQATIEDVIKKENLVAGSNPFARTSYGFDNMKNNIVLGNHSDYYDDDTVNSAGIVRERLNVGTRDLLIEKNQRQAKLIDRSLLDEMRYDVCDARDYIDAAINNVATEMQIRKIQELVYNQLLESPKMATAGNVYSELKAMLYVDATTPVALGDQTDNQFANTLRNLSAYCNIMRNNGANGKTIIFLLDTDTIQQLSKQQFYTVENGTGILGLSALPVFGQNTRLNALLNAGGDNFEIVEILGADKNLDDTYYDVNITNNKVNFLIVKELHQYVDLLDISTISDGKIISGAEAIKDFTAMTMTSPIDATALVLTNHSRVFASGMNYTNKACSLCSKFDI